MCLGRPSLGSLIVDGRTKPGRPVEEKEEEEEWSMAFVVRSADGVTITKHRERRSTTAFLSRTSQRSNKPAFSYKQKIFFPPSVPNQTSLHFRRFRYGSLSGGSSLLSSYSLLSCRCRRRRILIPIRNLPRESFLTRSYNSASCFKTMRVRVHDSVMCRNGNRQAAR